MSYWLGKLDQSGYLDPAEAHYFINEAQRRPLREIGEAAVPFLMKRMTAGLTAARWRSRLAGWGWQLPFRLLGARLDERSKSMAEARLGFIALREKGAEAIPALASLVPLNEAHSEVLLDAIASIGAAGVIAISNALTSPSVLVQVTAVRSAGLLRESGTPIVPLLISFLNDTNALHPSSSGAARSLGMIGRPVEPVLLALQDALASTNETLRANAVVGLMLMRESAKPAVSRIEDALLRETNGLSLALVAGLVVLCEDDARIERTLSGTFGNSPERSGANLRTNISAIRNGWNNRSNSRNTKDWESFRSAAKRIASGTASK